MTATFGTKPEEDISYHNSNTLAIAATVSMLILSILEPASYYLYNRKVSVGIMKYTQPATRDNKLCQFLTFHSSTPG